MLAASRAVATVASTQMTADTATWPSPMLPIAYSVVEAIGAVGGM
jgi:hypothetical protein